MPTAIVDLDVENLPGSVAVPESCRVALVLIRFGGVPVGAVRIPAEGGRLLGPDLLNRLVRVCGQTLWHQRLLRDLHLAPHGLEERSFPRSTVAVCTRDRPDDLRRCLVALTGLPDDGQELMVVDNASATPATREVVAGFPGVTYVREDTPGLDAARNRALRDARHDIVAFTDDDARVDPHWLRGLLRNFGDPLVLCVTGLTMPAELETPAQEQFESISPFGRGFERRVYQSGTHDPLLAGRMGAGVNMAVRRRVLDRLGGFDEALDAGTPTASGGDHDLFTRVLAAGYRVVYDPAALVWHRHRRDPRSLRTALQGYGTGVYAAWTRSLLWEHELRVPVVAWRWLRHDQLPSLLHALMGRRSGPPLRFVVAELWGCALGPWRYLRSRRAVRRRAVHG